MVSTLISHWNPWDIRTHLNQILRMIRAKWLLDLPSSGNLGLQELVLYQQSDFEHIILSNLISFKSSNIPRLYHYLVDTAIPEDNRGTRHALSGHTLGNSGSGRRNQNIPPNRSWLVLPSRGYAYHADANDVDSENEVATISAAITAREISDRRSQALAVAGIYPDSSLPSYNQGKMSYQNI